MAYDLLDFSRLPAPKVVQALSYEAILADKIADARARLPEWTTYGLESDPVVKLLQKFAYDELLLRADINDAAKAVLLAHAAAGDLDHLAAGREVARLEGESDAALRRRAQQGFWRVSTAGPTNAYKQLAFGASADVVDVGVHSPREGAIQVSVLAKQAAPTDATATELAYGLEAFGEEGWIIARSDSAVLDSVRSALSQDDATPLTDQWVVLPPAIIPYTLNAELTLYPGPSEGLVLERSRAELEVQLAGIKRIGYDVTRALLEDAVVVPGVQDVALRLAHVTGLAGAGLQTEWAYAFDVPDGALALCLSRIVYAAAERKV